MELVFLRSVHDRAEVERQLRIAVHDRDGRDGGADRGVAADQLDFARSVFLAAFIILALYTYSSGLRAPALIAFVKDIMIYIVVLAAVAAFAAWLPAGLTAAAVTTRNVQRSCTATSNSTTSCSTRPTWDGSSPCSTGR